MIVSRCIVSSFDSIGSNNRSILSANNTYGSKWDCLVMIPSAFIVKTSLMQAVSTEIIWDDLRLLTSAVNLPAFYKRLLPLHLVSDQLADDMLLRRLALQIDAVLLLP